MIKINQMLIKSALKFHVVVVRIIKKNFCQTVWPRLRTYARIIDNKSNEFRIY